jgi:hypothetical protein
MGFLDRLEHAVEGSGVSVDIDMQSSMDDQSQQVQVILTARHEPRVVTDVELRVVRRETIETNSPSMNMPVPNELSETGSHTILTLSHPARAELQPHQPLAVPFELQLSAILGGAMAGGGGFTGGGGGFVGGAGRIEPEVSGGYYLQARATVHGSHLHPQATRRLRQDTASGGWLFGG